jgi:acyl-coenzyme A thioesterase PaaI-like protein
MTQSIDPLKRGIGSSARRMRRLMNLWPPLLFAGIRILEWDADFRRVKVRLGYHRLNTNYFHTQYGGSLFSMTDPFWSIMLLHALGPHYTVWDQRGEIEFIAPGRTAVTTEMVIDQSVVDELRVAAGSGGKVLRWFESELVDRDGNVVARVRKQVYVRRKREIAA